MRFPMKLCELGVMCMVVIPAWYLGKGAVVESHPIDNRLVYCSCAQIVRKVPTEKLMGAALWPHNRKYEVRNR